ncbi:MAG: hypothetical protein EXR78_06955 [Deltaproteobacteria bacterium]|nr:hypothetical protein [Deltaproteobacteria bacterium]
MKVWKAVSSVLFVAGVLTLASCKQEKAPPKPLELDALTVCRNECKTSSEKMFQQCSDKMTSEQAFDRMSECNTQADDFSKKCRAECDQKTAGK